ncbi:MAG: HlyD family secretion protein [Pseudomonadota bacterium]
MEMLLLLTYVAICVVVFKVFKIPLNKWTVPTAALGGVALIGAIMLVMNYNHPYSEVMREYFVTTPIVPDVSGTVVEVMAEPNQLLSEGDPLFQIDPAPYQAAVDSLTARLTVAKADFERAEKLLSKGNVSRRDFDQAQANYTDLTAQLTQAQFDLDHTLVRAPTSGFVTHEFLRPGMRAVAAPLRPVMIFVHREDATYTAFFRQNSLLRLEAGEAAEIAFDGIPGEVFEAEVIGVVPALKEGQVQASGDMISYQKSPFPGRIPVVLKITDPEFDQYKDVVPGGAYGQAAIYSEHAHHFALIRKILLRMASWLNYAFPLH